MHERILQYLQQHCNMFLVDKPIKDKLPSLVHGDARNLELETREGLIEENFQYGVILFDKQL
jgi:hypothetical protein